MNHNLGKAIVILFIITSFGLALDALENSSPISNQLNGSWAALDTPSINSLEKSIPICNCNIIYNVNDIKTKSILVSNACETLNGILKDKIERGISIGAIFYDTETEISNFQNQNGVIVRRLTYEILLDNKGDPSIDNLILDAELCDGLKYESSSLKGSTTGMYDPTVIQDEKNHTTSRVRWSLEQLKPGEKRAILLNTLYIGNNNPIDPFKTKFNMSATVWDYEFNKLNGQIHQFNIE